MKNMIRDISGNDAAILIIDAQKGAFEAGIQKGDKTLKEPIGSTVEHPLIT